MSRSMFVGPSITVDPGVKRIAEENPLPDLMRRETYLLVSPSPARTIEPSRQNSRPFWTGSESYSWALAAIIWMVAIRRMGVVVIEDVDRVGGRRIGQGEALAILNARERALLDHVGKLGFGRLTIIVQDGQPVRSEESVKQVSYGR